MKPWRTWLIAPVLALSTPLTAGPAAAQTVPPIGYEIFTLDNGLRFIVHEDHSTPVVAVNVYYDVGSANERPGRSGFAHLFEHMLFQETENLEKGAFMSMIPAAGGEFNGTTDTDRTMYYEVLPSNRLNLALWMEAERMARLLVTAENFQREREVVKEERRMRIENQPYGNSFLTVDTLAMDYEPYDHTVIGSMDDLNAATAEDVRAFYEEYYNPNNATIVIAGDATVEQVRALAEQYFGDIARGPEVAPLPEPTPTPRTDGERRVTLVDDLANLPLLFSAYNIPPHSAEDTYALELLSRIFSQGESSRLYRRLVDEEEAALQVFSFLNSRYGPGTMIFGALPNQGVSVDVLEQLIQEEIDELRAEGVTERELQKAKNQLRAGQIQSRLTVMSKSVALQHARFMHGDVANVNQDIDRYMAVTAQDILDVARRYLAPENRTVVVTVPPQTTT
ncbi:MAG: M16 family metallopeptidase [Longimicrobiales bacterium]